MCAGTPLHEPLDNQQLPFQPSICCFHCRWTAICSRLGRMHCGWRSARPARLTLMMVSSKGEVTCACAGLLGCGIAPWGWHTLGIETCMLSAVVAKQHQCCSSEASAACAAASWQWWTNAWRRTWRCSRPPSRTSWMSSRSAATVSALLPLPQLLCCPHKSIFQLFDVACHFSFPSKQQLAFNTAGI